jgi:hypothetical protein
MQNYTFEIDLIFELDGSSMTVQVDYETDNPDGIIDANWGRDFQDMILENISIVPLNYEEV